MLNGGLVLAFAGAAVRNLLVLPPLESPPQEKLPTNIYTSAGWVGYDFGVPGKFAARPMGLAGNGPPLPVVMIAAMELRCFSEQ